MEWFAIQNNLPLSHRPYNTSPHPLLLPHSAISLGYNSRPKRNRRQWLWQSESWSLWKWWRKFCHFNIPTAGKASKHNWFLIFVWIAGVFLISHIYRQISDNWGVTGLISFLVYRFLMWHVPQIFHRLPVRLSNKFLKIECHHYTKLIKNMNSIIRWGWVRYEKFCRTDRLVLFVSDSSLR